MNPAPDGYDPAYFSVLAAVEARHFWFRARNRVIADAARRVTSGLPPGYRVLEVGCGTGQVLAALAEACPEGRVIGLDLYGQGLDFARQRSAVPLVQADVRRPPFVRGFEVVGAFDVIEHLEDDVAALRSIRAVTAPGGALLVTVPADPRLWSSFDEASHHCRRYTAHTLRSALTAGGFEPELVTSYMAATFPLMFLSRKVGGLIARMRPGRADAARRQTEQDLRVVPVVNGVLLQILLAEAGLIRAGRVLPFGSSLLAVARRN